MTDPTGRDLHSKPITHIFATSAASAPLDVNPGQGRALAPDAQTIPNSTPKWIAAGSTDRPSGLDLGSDGGNGQEAPPASLSKSHKIRLLVADDDDLVRRCYARALGHRFDLVLVEDGHRAMEAATKLSPAVALMDVNMPGLTGIQVAQRLLEMPDPPEILLISGAFAAPGAADHAVPEGVLACLPKPLDIELLMQWLERALEQHRARRRPP